jgi:hypothetical protein
MRGPARFGKSGEGLRGFPEFAFRLWNLFLAELPVLTAPIRLAAGIAGCALRPSALPHVWAFIVALTDLPRTRWWMWNSTACEVLPLRKCPSQPAPLQSA